MRNPLKLLRMGRGCCLVLAFILLLLFLVTCIAAAWGVGQAFADSNEQGLDVLLLMDQSNSLWELGGAGSDPEMLRMEGARLVAAYLGVDHLVKEHRLGVIYFGSQPRLIVPLTTLDPAGREEVLEALNQPPKPMGWTDLNAAMAWAYRELFESERADSNHATAIILFTDGRPQTEALDTPAAFDVYLTGLQDWVHHFADQETVVFTVLLSSAATDADPRTRDLYRPLWVDLAESGIGIGFYEARSDQDLGDIYHDIAVQLHRDRSQGAVLDQMVEDQTEVPIQVPAGWQRASFVIRKANPDMEVIVRRPDGNPLRVGLPGVHHVAEPGEAHHEVWSVDEPRPGAWLVQARGQGMVTVWLDYLPAPETPTPTPTFTPIATASPTPTATSIPTAVPSRMATFTPTPLPTPTSLSVTRGGLHILEPRTGTRYPVGRSVQVTIQFPGGDAADVHVFLLGDGQPTPVSVPVANDEAGYLSGQTPSLEAAGLYTLTVRRTSDLGRGVILLDEACITFRVESRRRRSLWALFAGVLALVGGTGGLWWRHRNRPLVDGTLCLVEGPKEEQVGRTWDLEEFGSGAITLGASTSCDIVLAHDPSVAHQVAVVRIERDADGHSRPVLVALGQDTPIQVNEHVLWKGHRLGDGDTVQIGTYRLQYENLRLRMQDLAWRPESVVHQTSHIA